MSASTRKLVSSMRARDVRGRRTMELVHRALVGLIEEQPLERITTDDIVRRAGVSRSTFYRHYADKEALIGEIARVEIARLVELVIPLTDHADSLAQCRHMVAYVDEHRKLWSILLTGGAAGVMRQKFIELATPDAQSSRATSLHGIPSDLSVRAGVAVTVEILAWWLGNPGEVTAEHVAEYVDRLAVRPGLDPPRQPRSAR